MSVATHTPPENEGWAPYGADGFEKFLGQLYTRPWAEGFEFTMQIGPQHCNDLGNAHGGCMLALADVFLSGTCFLDDRVQEHFVTVDLSHDFLGGAPLGSWVRGQGRLRKHGRSIMFPECEFFIGNELIGHARCVMKKLKPRG